MAYKIERILSKLEQVRPRGRFKWIARCPAHNDKEPSLTIEETYDKILLFCWSGCNTHDVLTAIGMTWEDLFFAEHGPILKGAPIIKEEDKPQKFEKTIAFYKRKLERGEILTDREIRLVEFCLEQIEE